MAPRLFIFSIVLGAERLSYVKSIETHAHTFLPLNISVVGSVVCFVYMLDPNYKVHLLCKLSNALLDTQASIS